MKLKVLTSIILLCSMSMSNAVAANKWYWGKITQIFTHSSDGSFTVYSDNPNLISLCQYDKVLFRVSDMGTERTKVALTMALTAFTAGKEWGVIIDDSTTPNTTCYASVTPSQAAGIR